MHLSLTDFIGILGVTVIIIAYMLLQLEKMDAKDLSFSVLNTLGALLIIISLLYDWNLASFLMESIWMFISLYGILKYYKLKKREENAAKNDGKED
jgi:predicted membrane protein